jgi:putative DNA methylase
MPLLYIQIPCPSFPQTHLITTISVYADLSDFFYVWLRRSLKSVFPDLFATLAVPEDRRVGSYTLSTRRQRDRLKSFFLEGMTQAMHSLAEQAHPAFPVTIYYAFKQSETESVEGTVSYRMGNFPRCGDTRQASLSAVLGRCEQNVMQPQGRSASAANALASSIVLVCRPRAANAPQQRGASSSINSKPNCPIALRFAAQATSRRWIWRRQPSAPAWRSTPALPKCWTPQATHCRCARRWR